METNLAPNWTKVRSGNDYTPGDREVVWTTDGDVVRKGRFELDLEALLKQGEQGGTGRWDVPGVWLDEADSPIIVTHWIGFTEWSGSEAPGAP